MPAAKQRDHGGKDADGAIPVPQSLPFLADLRFRHLSLADEKLAGNARLKASSVMSDQSHPLPFI